MKAIKRVTIVVILQMLMVGIAHGQQFNPPAEAYKACEGKSVGSAAQLINPSGETISGICEEVNGKLLLRPDRSKGVDREITPPGQTSGQHYQMKEIPPRKIELPVGSNKVYVTRAVPDVESESGLKNKDFKAEAVKVVGGKVALSVDWVPIFIEEKEPTGLAETDPESSPFGFHPAYTYKSVVDRHRLREPSEMGYDYSHPIDMGVVWNRPEYYALWDKIQKNDEDISEGKFDWKETDYVYGSVPKGMRIMGNIGGIARRTNKEENPKRRTFTFKSEFYEKNFSIFVKNLVERYDGDGVNDMPGLKNPVKYWQIENEPDIATRDWKGYAKLVEAAGKAVKDACFDCKVVMGGMAAPQALESFYIPVMRELKGKYVDVFDFHFFGMAGEWVNFQRGYASIRKALDSNGFPNAEIWITETGTYTGNPRVPVRKLGDQGTMDQRRLDFKVLSTQSEKQQAAEVVKRYVYALSLGIKKVFWAFGIMEGFSGNDGQFDHTGFIYDGQYEDNPRRGVKKLSYYTYKLMTEKLGGSDFSNIKQIEIGTGVYAYKFMKSGRAVYVVWVN